MVSFEVRTNKKQWTRTRSNPRWRRWGDVTAAMATRNKSDRTHRSLPLLPPPPHSHLLISVKAKQYRTMKSINYGRKTIKKKNNLTVYVYSRLVSAATDWDAVLLNSMEWKRYQKTHCIWNSWGKKRWKMKTCLLLGIMYCNKIYIVFNILYLQL